MGLGVERIRTLQLTKLMRPQGPHQLVQTLSQLPVLRQSQNILL